MTDSLLIWGLAFFKPLPVKPGLLLGPFKYLLCFTEEALPDSRVENKATLLPFCLLTAGRP